MVAESAGVDPALRAPPGVVPLVRRFLPLLAAVVLMAPSCPDLGPADFDPEARRPFAPYAAGSDLIYVSAGSVRGSSVYVVAMPEGRIVARLDGPDFPWLFAPDGRTAFFTVTKFDAGGQQILHRIDLRTGERLLRVDTGAATHPTGPRADFVAASYGSLAFAADSDVFLARIEGSRLSDGTYADQHIRVQRLDSRTGARRAERIWPGSVHGTHVWIVALRPDLLLLGRNLADEQRAVAQDWIFVRPDFSEIGSLSSLRDDLPADTQCDPGLREIPNGNQWATVCAAPRAPLTPDAIREIRPGEARPYLDPEIRSPASTRQSPSFVLFIDRETLRPTQRVALSASDDASELGIPLDWAVLADGTVVVLTDQAIVRVNRERVETIFAASRTPPLPAWWGPRLAADGRFVYAQFLSESAKRIALVDARTGNVIASTELERVETLDLALSPSVETLYVKARHYGESTSYVYALDPSTLSIRSRSARLPEPPIAGGIHAVVSTR